MRLFDASAWTGQWPFTTLGDTDLTSLISLLCAAGITGAAVSPLAAALGPDPMTANRVLLEDAIAFERAIRLRTVPVLDPSLPGWEADLEELLDRYDPGAIKLVPNYHGYDIDGPAPIALAQAVTDAGLGLCIQLRILDERAHHPLMKVPGVPAEGITRLAAAVPDARILACGAYRTDLPLLATAPNIMAELSSVESGDTLADALAVLGPDRLLLGTHAPIYYSLPGVVKVTASGQSDDILTRIASGNATAFFSGTSSTEST